MPVSLGPDDYQGYFNLRDCLVTLCLSCWPWAPADKPPGGEMLPGSLHWGGIWKAKAHLEIWCWTWLWKATGRMPTGISSIMLKNMSYSARDCYFCICLIEGNGHMNKKKEKKKQFLALPVLSPYSFSLASSLFMLISQGTHLLWGNLHSYPLSPVKEDSRV